MTITQGEIHKMAVIAHSLQIAQRQNALSDGFIITCQPESAAQEELIDYTSGLSLFAGLKLCCY